VPVPSDGVAPAARGQPFFIGSMALYAATIFVSAFLLFLVQPIMAKQILPWFGGSANVWTTCLVFFQTTLLLGYAYADLLVRRTSARTQIRVHVLLLALSCIVLPIVPGAQWKPLGTESPSLLILALLAATIGLPYFLLSTTSPLVQAWFSRSFPGRSPYRLFALSNLASMLALLGYPIGLEPWVTTRFQSYGWSAAYVVFALLCAGCGWFSLRAAHVPVEPAQEQDASLQDDVPPRGTRQLLWAALAATGSFLLLAITNHLCQNISSIPLLWVVPLSIYLLTFILCFDGRGWYRPELFASMLAAALGVMAWTLADHDLTHKLELQIGVFCVGLFLACMFCHGELARLKPAPRYLTRFYLMVSAGGAVGSALVGLVAPLVLPAYFELAFGLAACAALLAFQVRRRHPVFIALAIVALLFTVGAGAWQVHDFFDATLLATRNFYGVLRVQLYGDTDTSRHRSLTHGTILHGTQYLESDLARRPTTYYTQTSGVGRALESMHPTTRPLKIGVIGLGAGTLATYGSKGDIYRFYDINPAVIVIANRDFTYLRDSDATIQTPLGDARLNLEREAPQGFDLLAIDAFSSDSIPVHLLTNEALTVYVKHMKPGGIIAFHLTNRFLDLIPVVKQLADAHHLFSVLVTDEGNEGIASRSDWVLLSDREASLQVPQIAEAASEIPVRENLRLWTDDFNNIVQILK
ncbi:MAG TPA: fused MFS/spermidine synthase, partial [Casimicrobiaceae bacterium]|nr:fused MFS/spermidine synthase [Casimicrobiaceae bacterium]